MTGKLPVRRTANKSSQAVEASPVQQTTVSPEPKPIKYTGTASYYSRAGCIGCSKTLTMANGKPLDDSKLTVAYNRAKLNSFVNIKNLKNGKNVRAKVTDTGGFERHGRIIDLTIATRDAISCSDLCKVEITHEIGT
jgi:rare lipoprotein A (peptidoglycan hydrolase)